jgi:hypothetical protein
MVKLGQPASSVIAYDIDARQWDVITAAPSGARYDNTSAPPRQSFQLVSVPALGGIVLLGISILLPFFQIMSLSFIQSFTTSPSSFPLITAID